MAFIDTIYNQGSGAAASTPDTPEKQAEFAAAPTEYTGGGNIAGLLAVLVLFYILIYALTLVERWLE